MLVRKGVCRLIAVALVVGCADGTSPGVSPASLSSISGNWQAGAVGQPLSVPLVVEVKGRDSIPLAGVAVDFRVSAGTADLSPTSAATDQLGRVSVTVTPTAPGVVQVTATVRNSSLFFKFFLSAAGGVAGTCEPTRARLLAKGQVVTDLGGAGVCLSGSDSGATFALIAFNADLVPDAALAVQLTTTGTLAAVRAPSPPGARVLERSESASTSVASGIRGNAVGVNSLASLAVGDAYTFNANLTDACTNPVLRTGRVVAITTTAVVVADNTNPSAGLTDAEYAAVGQEFDTLWNPAVSLNIGNPSDIDNNTRVVLVFTRAMNASAASLPTHPTVLFLARDLRPATPNPSTPLPACGGSNVAEMLYIVAADPNGAAGGMIQKAALLQQLPRAGAHSLWHLINASRRLAANPVRPQEQTWIEEGFGQIAEELTFHRASARASRQNISVLDLTQTFQSLNAFQAFQRPNVDNYVAFLRSPSSVSPLSSDASPATRGATWSLLRYLVDRSQPPDYNRWTELVNSQTVGVANLMGVFGSDLPLQMRDWTISLLTDDLFATEARYRQPSWDLHSVIAVLYPGPFPLAIMPLPVNGTVTASVVAGSAGYFRFRVAAGASGSVGWSGTAGAAVPPRILWSVVRLD